MDIEQSPPILTLIYHNFRGMAQTIRYVLLYLQLPFQQMFPKPGQNPNDLDVLKNVVTSTNMDLPYLVSGNKCVQGFYAIIRHLCDLAGRQDLLGQNIEERTIVREVFYNLVVVKKQQIKLYFSFGQKALKDPENKEKIRKMAMERSHQLSESVVPLVKLKLRNPSQKYVFGHITLLDFVFFQQSFYQLNLFGNLELKNCAVYDVINSIFRTELSNVKEKSSLYLSVMRQFRDTFEKEQFYVKNKDKLESYTMICPNMSKTTIEGFRNVWLGPQSYIK